MISRFYLDDEESTMIASFSDAVQFNVGDKLQVSVRPYRKLDHLKVEQRERLVEERGLLIDKLNLKTVEIISFNRYIENNGDIDKLTLEYFCRIVDDEIFQGTL